MKYERTHTTHIASWFGLSFMWVIGHMGGMQAFYNA
jgi:hypothetical protein